MTKKLITRMNKKPAPLRAENDVLHAFRLKLHELLILVCRTKRCLNTVLPVRKKNNNPPLVAIKTLNSSVPLSLSQPFKKWRYI